MKYTLCRCKTFEERQYTKKLEGNFGTKQSIFLYIVCAYV